MQIGWAWEWLPPKCQATGRHEWVRNSFSVTGYEAGATRSAVWWRCLWCGKRTTTDPRPLRAGPEKGE